MRTKALKQKKNLESSPFWNPESTELKSGIQCSESGIHRVESRIHDCHGFPYMGRLLEHGRNKIVSVNRPSSAKMWHYLALRKSVLLPIKTASTHVTNKLPTLPIFRTVHDTSNVWPEKAFGGARTCSTLKSGNALVWNPQTGLGIKAPELRTYSILHSKRLSAG